MEEYRRLCRKEDNIKMNLKELGVDVMNLKEIGVEIMNLMVLPQDRDEKRALVNVALSFQVL